MKYEIISEPWINWIITHQVAVPYVGVSFQISDKKLPCTEEAVRSTQIQDSFGSATTCIRLWNFCEKTRQTKALQG